MTSRSNSGTSGSSEPHCLDAFLSKSLAMAEKELEELSGVGSASSEGRDNLKVRERDDDQQSHQSTSQSLPSTSQSLPLTSQSLQSMSQSLQSTASVEGSKPRARPRDPTSIVEQVVDDVAVKVEIGPIQKEVVSQVVKDVVEEQVAQVTKLKMDLETMEQRESEAVEEVKRKQAWLDMMQEEVDDKARLKELLQQKDLDKNFLADQRDELVDQIAGLEARQAARDERRERDVRSLRLWHEERHEMRASEFKKRREHMSRELEALSKQAMEAKEETAQVTADRDALKLKKEAMEEEEQAVVERVWRDLEAAQTELRIESQEKVKLLEHVGHVDAAKEASKRVDLQRRLMESRESNRAIQAELFSLRLEMHQKTQQQQDSAAASDAPMPLDGGKQQRLIQKGRKQKFAAPKLEAIDEDDPDDELLSGAMSGISGHLSSDTESVANLDEFDCDDMDDDTGVERVHRVNAEAKNKIFKLQAELALKDHVKNALHDEVAEEKAKASSKVKRLQEKVELAQVEKNEAAHQAYEAYAMKRNAEEAKEEVRLSMQMQLQQKEAEKSHILKAVKDEKIEKEQTMEELRNQLVLAMEATRVERRRLEDTRQAFASLEKKHAEVVEGLNEQLAMYQGEGPDEDSLHGHLQSVMEERNMLKNELEWLRVQSQGLLENEQQGHALTSSQLRKAEKQLHDEKNTVTKLRDALAEAHSSYEELLQKQEDLTTRPTSIFDLLRCPTRAAPAPASSGPCLQQIIWQTLSVMRGVVAVMCDADTLSIRHASKAATVVWGVACTSGKPLLPLTSTPDAATWLQRELAGQPRTAGVYELGCLEFGNKSSAVFDAMVVVVYLEEEPAINRRAAFILIVEAFQEEPQARPKRSSQWSDGPLLPKPSFMQHSASSVVSDDISPNDSVSSINAK